MKSLTLNNLGKKFLVEETDNIRMHDLLAAYRQQFKQIALTSALQAAGWNVELTTSKTYRGGVRLWLKCPQCGKRIGVLFRHPLTGAMGCRQCLNLGYRRQQLNN